MPSNHCGGAILIEAFPKYYIVSEFGKQSYNNKVWAPLNPNYFSHV